MAHIHLSSSNFDFGDAYYSSASPLLASQPLTVFNDSPSSVALKLARKTSDLSFRDKPVEPVEVHLSNLDHQTNPQRFSDEDVYILRSNESRDFCILLMPAADRKQERTSYFKVKHITCTAKQIR